MGTFPPGIVSSAIKDSLKLRIITKVNVKTMQDSSKANMIFGVAKTTAF